MVRADVAVNGRRDTQGTLVLDFDGTVCLGDGLIWAYANGALADLEPGTADRVRDGIAVHLAGGSGEDGYADGYQAVADLAGPYVSAETLSEAYLASRRALESGAVEVHAPDGLAQLLSALRPRVTVLVVTNAPDIGLASALDRLGLADHVDDVIASADKPARSERMLAALVRRDAAPTLMSVGDVWVNDIEPALEFGCATAFIDHRGTDPRPAHIRGQSIQDLYAGIERWSRAPHEFVVTHRPGGHSGRFTPVRSTS